MLYSISEKCKKSTAWVLFVTFYLQLVSPVLANIIQAPVVTRHAANSISKKGKSVLPEAVMFKLSTAAGVMPDKAPAVIPPAPVKNKMVLPLVQEKKDPLPAKQKKGKHIGPTQPEMQSFQSVNAGNMVDLFSGDFSYNIPLMDVGGYPVNLHYSSGVSMDQEASWVGLGWNINPGTISRNMRGIPDDFNGTDKISKTLSMKDNVTIGVTGGANAELLGKSVKKPVPASKTKDSVMGRPTSLGFSIGVFHNSYNGWGTETGINAGINAGRGAKGHLSGGLSITNNSQNGLDVSPSFGFRMNKDIEKNKGNISIGTNYNSRVGVQSLQLSMQNRQQVNVAKNVSVNRFVNESAGVPVSGTISFATPSFTPSIGIPFTSVQFSYTAKLGSEAWAYHPNFFVQGSYSRQYIKEEDRTSSLPAYGYLYYQEAEGQDKVLLDFNREKEVAFRGTTPHIAIPAYTYDIYSISGEGTGGMFRPYRGDVGIIYDHAMATKSASGRVSVDIGLSGQPDNFHIGTDLNAVWASTKTNPWRSDNVMARFTGFKKQDSLYENVYFKNPGEKVTVDQEFYDKIGDDKLVRVQLTPQYGQNSPVVTATKNLTMFSNARPVGTSTLDVSAYKSKRDKRTQVISYLTAAEATQFALDKEIRSFNINSFPATSCNTNYQVIKRIDTVRKPHHLSEIAVLGSDGRRYIYGVPAYNVEQQDVSFAVDKSGGNNATGLVAYNPGVDNTPANIQGKDHFYSREVVPAYAHSFLLSSIVSQDYADITGDGVSEDDNGDAVRFNYSRIYGTSNPFRWRAPYDENKAAYNEGLKTYSRDDRGSYTYGTKEIWYMNSIESKTMLATFVLETDTLRKDAYGVIGENGGRSSTQHLYRLKQINLYTKADYLKNGTSAKPVKSVHFEYSYELCSGAPSSNNAGKLTLKKVWFSYNKNYKGRLNPYSFTYHTNNPSFNSKSYDRWGNYKDPADNPGAAGNTLTNAEYPYTLQKGVNNWDSTKAANNMAAWMLKEIKLPSGGLMKVSYESDDYGYVQNRRAMQLFAVEGFGLNAADAPENLLYKRESKSNDYHYVFVRLNDAVNSREDITERYLEGVKKLYFKMFVKMPDSKDGDRWGTGYEQIPCFADIEDYGIKAGYANKMIWIKVASLKKDRSPMATAAIQYLRVNHPAKAFPYSEPGDNVKVKDVIGMILSAASNVKNSIDGFEDQARKKNWCNDIDPAKTFVRLNNPDCKKLGGGLRVKRVEIFDNWQKMTGQTEASYGQTYDYSTTKLLNNEPVRISSGVASYEPVLGKEENPFYQPIEYAEKMAALGPTDYIFTEEPLGESFFPSASIGYSRVTVQTINNTKKSANGLNVSEFYTAQDFPTLFENTPLDNESKKSFANPIGNFFKFDAKRYVTLSQGFKVELNDMHGKVKSQSTFAQTDLKNPISYTYNYYRLDNDNALLNRHLSSKVVTADSANGVLRNSQMGKEVEMLIDIREQTSRTVSASVQLNIDVVPTKPIPFPIPSIPNLPTFETNRYRSIAVTKIVNRYGILDSVVHIDKGSKISTANMVYDGETGNVLLSRTQNEFDDPVYAFSYPAYWAYSGMGAAYKNIGGLFKNAAFYSGRMNWRGSTPASLNQYFESGDELLFFGKLKKKPAGSNCESESYAGLRDTAIKIWAIDAAKSGTNASGIYFIDKDGIPVTGYASYVKIIRSGKRNMLGVSAGSITSLQSPVKLVNGVTRLVFDSTIGIIAAGAARFKDFWKVDSNSYRKDTVIRVPKLVGYGCDNFISITADQNYSILRFLKNNTPSAYIGRGNSYFETYSQSFGCSNGHTQKRLKSWMRFDLSSIPNGSIITSASLSLRAPLPTYPQYWERHGDFTSNAAYISRTTGPWIGDLIMQNNSFFALGRYFDNLGGAEIDYSTRVPVNLTPAPTATSGPTSSTNSGFFTLTQMAQDMLNNYYANNRRFKPAMVMEMQDWGACNWRGTNRMNFGFNTGTCQAHSNVNENCSPIMQICYIPACADGTTPVYSATPVPGYYCQSEPIDSFVCKPNISDTATNPYRWGIWGNWQTDRAYTYYGNRKETDPAAATTNIRKNGEIAGFVPYWSFTNSLLQPSQDSSRWVWNSEINLINSKGLELQNHDPLDRYNSAQYGYNQTLPVAVAQNSRNRQMVYDGFEDYGYRTDTCKNCPSGRFINMVAGGTLVDTVSHTGLYSLRVGGNGTDSVTVPVVSAAVDAILPSVTVKVDSLRVKTVAVKGKGTGLLGQYWNKYIGYYFGIPRIKEEDCHTRIDSVIDFTQWGAGVPAPFCSNVGNKVIWTGYIQPRYTELYTFHVTAQSRMSVWINGKRISQNSPVQYTSGTFPLDTISLIAGKLYPVRIEVQKASWIGNMAAVFAWSSMSEPKAVVPKSQLYTFTDTTGTTTSDSVWCIKLNSPKPKAVTHNAFSPLQGTVMVVGAWVKERNNNADTVTSFRNVQMQVVFSKWAYPNLKANRQYH